VSPTRLMRAAMDANDLESAVRGAVATLRKATTCAASQCQTHKVLLVQGWAASARTMDCLATYLVGLLAATISRTLEVRAQITNSAKDRLELLRSVEQIVGSAAAPLNDDQKQDQRNPWIAEGLWHLYLFLSAQEPALRAAGEVVALDFPHVTAKDHGLDVLAIYRDGTQYGVTIVECKAYEANPNGAINDAVRTFKQVDNGRHDTRIRQFVATVRSALPVAQQDQVSASLWKDLRSYVPNPHYDETTKPMNWTNKRTSFTGLSVPADRVIVMPHAIKQFTMFFDDVASAMLKVAQRFNV
jgi:hypothetical protein